MPWNQFTYEQLAWFFTGLLFISGSIIFFHAEHMRWSMGLLAIGAFFIGMFMVRLDPFLNLWDEQFHALVAKNMASHPFKPMLYADPLLPYDIQRWDANHIWLHKQPLFLWQMALSIKLFGANEISVRLPSVIMHALVPLFIYRIGKIIANEKMGYYGALFFAVAFFPLQLMVGRYSTDHNDLAFLFYVTASFWSWFEYQETEKRKWIILTGIFSGGAVLVKWLVGLLVFAVWGIVCFIQAKQDKWNFKKFVPLLGAFAIAVLVFLPWQIYILFAFPVEAVHEFSYNTRHMFEAIEGHDGNRWFHFEALRELYGLGAATPYVVFTGFVMLVFSITRFKFKAAVVSAVLIVYVFYTMAATKMTAFGLIASPFIFLGFGALVYLFFLILPLKKWMAISLQTICLLVLCYVMADSKQVASIHLKTEQNPAHDFNVKEMQLIEQLKKELRDEKYVVFNTNMTYRGNIPVMFYTSYVAYDFIPTREQLETVRKQGYKTAIVDTGNLPADILDTEMKIIKVQ